MQDSDVHKQRENARREALQDRLGHAENRQPQTTPQPPSAEPQTEARLHSLFRAAPIAICLVSNRVLLEVNDRMCEMVGYSREELLGRDARILYPSVEDYNYVGTVEYGQIREHGTGAVETRWRHKDGAVIDILLSSAALDVNDLSQGITFTALDVTASKKAEDELQSIFDLSLDMVCIADINTSTFVRVNPSFERVLGYPSCELLGRSFLDFIHPDDMEKTLALVQEKLQKGETVINFENRYHCQDGSYRWLNWTSHPRPERGLTYSIARDITEQKEAEEALRQSETRYRETASLLETLFDAIPDVIGLQDEKHQIVRYNAAGYAFLQTAPDNVHDRRCFELIGRDRPCEVCATSEVYRTKKPAQIEKYFEEMGIWLDVRAYPVLDDLGQITNVIEHLRDITAQKRSHKALEDSEARYRAVVEDQTEFICRFRPDGRVTFVNEAMCRFFGLSRDDLIGKSFAAWMIPEEHADLWRRLKTLTPEHPVETHENQGILPTNQEFWGQWTNRAIFDETGKVTEYQAVGRDVTEQKLAEKALRESETRFRELAEMLPQTVFEFDARGALIFGNRAGMEMFGYHAGELSDLNVLTLFTPQEHDRIAQNIQKRLRDEPVANREYQALRKNGSVFPMLLYASPVVRDGVPVGLRGIGLDITERKQVEEERQGRLDALESMERINRIIREATDPEQMLRDVVETVHSIFDSDRAWLLYPCDPDAPSFRVPVECTRPEYPGAFERNTDLPMKPGGDMVSAAVLASDGPVTYGPSTERPVCKKMTDEFGVLSMMITAVYPKIGEPWMFGLHQCSHPRVWTTEEQRLFQEIGHRIADGLSSMLSLRNLKESETRFRDLAELLPQMVFEADAEGRFTFANRLAFESFGYQPAELPALHLVDLFPLCDRQRLTENVRRQLQGEPSWDHEYVASRKDGTTFPILLYSAPIVRDGTPVGLRGIVVDITERQYAERALQESKAALESILESSPNAICVTNLAGDIVDCNQATLDMHGFSSKDELLGRGTLDLVAESDRAKTQENMKKTSDQGSTKDVELTLLRKDGREFPCEVSTSLMRDRAGHPMGLVAAMADITERKQGEKSLLQSERKYRELYEGSRDAVVSINMDGLILEWNSAFLDMLDYSPEEIRTKTYEDITPPQWHQNEARILNEQVLSRGYSDVYEKEYRRKDGTVFPVELRAYLNRDEDGARTGMWAFIRDITERKAAEWALLESERKLSTLMANLPGMAYRCRADEQWTMEFVSEGCTDLTGYASSDVTGNRRVSYDDIVHPEDRRRVHDEIQATLRTNDTFEIEYRIVTSQGREKWVWERGRRIGDAENGTLILEGFILDVSERQKAEEKLRAHQKKLRSLASELSLTEERERRRIAADLHDHACQNLVLSNMKLQGLRASLPAGQVQAIESICHTLNKTIENVRDLTFDLSSPTLYRFGLSAALEELLNDKLTAEHNIHHQFIDDGQPKPVSQDVLILLFQSVRELLINAIKHAQAHEVVLDMRREHNSISIVLTDDGIGFDVSDVLSFPSQKRSVGLFNILERLDYIGGGLDIKSELGHGSRFTLVAPLTMEVPVAKEPHDGTENSAR